MGDAASSAAKLPSLTGRSVGDFRLGDLIGQGGMGAVYRAQQVSLGREAAVKVMQPNPQYPGAVSRFLREVRLASTIDHPFAAHIYAFGQEPDGILWLAMELVRGVSLESMILQGPIPLDRFIPFFDRLCDVVHCAHEEGIVHRDIKPSNVMVVTRAGRLLPKLLDLGVAKQGMARFVERASETGTLERTFGGARIDPKLPGEGTPSPETKVPAIGSATYVEENVKRPSDASGAAAPERAPWSEAEETSAVSSSWTPRTPMIHIDPVEVSEESLRRAVVSDLTHHDYTVGSPNYMPPEQWVDATTVDGRSDIYALGALTYRALTGHHAFRGRSVAQVMRAHLDDPIPPLGPGFSPALDAVLVQAMAKNKADRFSTAIDFARSLRAAAEIQQDAGEARTLDEFLREDLVSEAPRPVAETTLMLEAVRTEGPLVARLQQLLETTAHWVGVVALACRSRVGTEKDSPQVKVLLEQLYKDRLTGAQWLELAFELCRPLAASSSAHPLPELVEFVVGPAGERTELFSLAVNTLSAKEPPTSASLATTVTRLLQAMGFLFDFPLAVQKTTGLELLTGSGRGRRGTAPLGVLPEQHPVLLDGDGGLAVDLWPLVQLASPSPGAPEELFLLGGAGRHGARLVSHPQGFERYDEELWSWFASQGLQLETARADAKVGDPSPYQGLASFTAAQSDNFFGREREAEAFVNRLRVVPLMGVVGPSGAGKSSFVQAGVVPLLGPRTHVISVRPGPTPIAALVSKLEQEGVDVSGLAQGLAADPTLLGRRLAELAERKGAVLLIVDQFEELVTLCLDGEERRRFALALASAGSAFSAAVRVVITLRDDFLIRVQSLPGLRERLTPGLQLLSTPAREDLQRILVEPARRAGFEFESPELATQMVEGVADLPGALALLSFAASKLWEFRDRHLKRLTRKAYDALGGVGGALAHHAEGMMAGFTPAQQLLVREAFRHLVTSQGTRAVLSRAELLQILSTERSGEQVLNSLIDARLLVTSEGVGGVDRVEVIHEALLSSWPTLVRWQKEDAENARIRDQIRVAARQWMDRERSRGLLWREEALAEYRLWRRRYPGRLTDAEEAFGKASLRDEVRLRWLRRAVALGVVLLVAGVLGAVRLKARADVRRLVAADVQQAQAVLEQASRVRAQKEQAVKEAFDGFGAGQVADGEAAWAKSRALLPELSGLYTRAAGAFEQAMQRDPSAPEPRDGLVKLLYARALEAEADHQLEQRDELVGRFTVYDASGELVKRWQAPARLDIVTTPPGAQVTVARYEAGAKGDSRPLGTTPLSAAELAPGSYLVELSAPGRLPVRYPVQVQRGEALKLEFPLPASQGVPKGYLFIPAGRFPVGTALPDLVRMLLNARPQRPGQTGDFFIAQQETTIAQWLEYVDALPAAQQGALLKAMGNQSIGQSGLVKLKDGRWQWTFSAGTSVYQVAQGEPFVYRERTQRARQDWLRFPVVGISYEDSQAYAAWLDRTGQVPGARLCTDFEWERAAKGADGRSYPHGDVLKPDDANFDETYGKKAEAYGPDEVGSHPQSTSPFGVEDIMGNVSEWVVGGEGDGAAVERGGGYFYQSLVGNVANRNPLATNFRSATIGLRLCATPRP